MINNIYKKYQKLINYAIVGLLTTLISIFTYYIFSEVFKITFIISNVFSWIIAVIFAFFTNKKYVFNSKRTDLKSEFIEFTFSRLFTLIFDIILMVVCLYLLNIPNLISKTIVQVVVIVLNYILGSKIFKV